MFGSCEFGQIKFGSIFVGEPEEVLEWPTLTSKPSWRGFKFEMIPDPNVQDASKNSYIARSGRLPLYRRYTIPYPFLTQDDKDILEEFQSEKVFYGSLEFLWTCPVTEEKYVMKLVKPIEFKALKGSSVRYSTEVELYGELVED